MTLFCLGDLQRIGLLRLGDFSWPIGFRLRDPSPGGGNPVPRRLCRGQLVYLLLAGRDRRVTTYPRRFGRRSPKFPSTDRAYPYIL